VEVAAIELHAAGGFVEMNDDDALTAGSSRRSRVPGRS
jgi:hypothetical protein